MKFLRTRLFYTLLGAALTVGAFSVHLVIYDGGVTLLFKEQLMWKGTYVNTRRMDAADLITLPAPVRNFLVEHQTGIIKKSLGLEKK
ncbi:MAG: hypothetical protein OEY85_07955 [Rhodospirillales bacterium]|nr:hypothetical protein [Rhodospirillales bacterium]